MSNTLGESAISSPQLATAPRHGTSLLAIAILTTAVVLVFLGAGDAQNMMELFNLVPVKEAMRDGHWLMPTLNGIPRLEKPPLPVWLPAALGMLLHSDSLWILRLPSLFMAVLTAMATYGMGCLFFENPADPPGRKRWFALLAALLLPTFLLFNTEGRLASYDIFATGFLTCGAYFLTLLAEDNSRLISRFWTYGILSGVTTGLSILSKGPVPAATVMLPLGLWLLMHHRKRRTWLGVLLAATVSITVFLPWLVAIGGIPGVFQGQVPGAWHVWTSEFLQFGTGDAAHAGAGTKAQLSDPWYYYLQFFIWIVPLTPTLIAGLVMPFFPVHSQPRPADREVRGRRLMWTLIVLGLLMLSIPAEKKARYTLQLMPFAALLCAAVWQEFIRLPQQRKVEPAARAMLAGQALFFIVPGATGLIVGLWVMATHGFPHWPVVADTVNATGPLAFLAAGAALLAGGLCLWHLEMRQRFARAAMVLVACASLMILLTQSMYRSLPQTRISPTRMAVEPAMTLAGYLGMDANLYTLKEARPWLPTLFYANRIVPEMDVQELIRTAQRDPAKDLWLMVVESVWDARKAVATPQAGVEEDLTALKKSTGRKRMRMTEWLDEGRRTVLWRFGAPTAPPNGP